MISTDVKWIHDYQTRLTWPL